ncbi:MAG: hypothetical protein KGI29_08830 [Pseudomonadota bacterium]|nr:hypothetical protein [Pseudomonadota bacterium]MDE3037683.1 hypothetical protein [Pseudomonadota bacterium]
MTDAPDVQSPDYQKIQETFLGIAGSIEAASNKITKHLGEVQDGISEARANKKIKQPSAGTKELTKLQGELRIANKAINQARMEASAIGKAGSEGNKEAYDKNVASFYAHMRTALRAIKDTPPHEKEIYSILENAHQALPHPDAATRESIAKEINIFNQAGKQSEFLSEIVTTLDNMHKQHPNFYDVDATHLNQINKNDKGRPEFGKQFKLAQKAAKAMVEAGKPAPKNVKQLHDAINAAIVELDAIKERAPEEFKGQPKFKDTIIEYSKEIKKGLEELRDDINEVPGLKDPARSAVDELHQQGLLTCQVSLCTGVPATHGVPSARSGLIIS